MYVVCLCVRKRDVTDVSILLLHLSTIRRHFASWYTQSLRATRARDMGVVVVVVVDMRSDDVYALQISLTYAETCSIRHEIQTVMLATECVTVWIRLIRSASP